MSLSYSRINTFLKCKRQFKFQYIDNLPYPETSALRIGSAVHKFLENYGKHCIGIYKPQDIEYAAKESKRLMSTMNPEDVNNFNEIIDKAIAMHNFEPALIEEKFALDINWKSTKWENARLRGVIDIHCEKGRVVKVTDYKTDRRIQPLSEVESDLQLKIYTVALSELYPEANTFEASKDFVRYGVIIGPVVYRREQLEDFKTYIGGILTNIENEKDYYPTVGSSCEYCPYYRKCEAYKQVDPDFSDKLDESKAAKMAEWLYRTEKRVKEAKDRLKDYVDTTQKNINFGDMFLGYSTRDKRSVINTEKLVNELIKNNIRKSDIWEYLGMPITSMEKILRKNERKDLIKDLSEKHYENTTETTFSFKKKIGESEE